MSNKKCNRYMKWEKNIGFRVTAHDKDGFYVVDWTLDGYYEANFYHFHLKKRNRYIGKFLDLQSAQNACEKSQ